MIQMPAWWHRHGMRKLLTFIVAGLLVVPALAIAGKKATSGDQTLQVSSTLSPAKAGKKGKAQPATLKFKIDYESTNADAQIKESSKSVVLNLPAGTTLHTGARGQCTYSQLNQGGPSACPSGARVGQGTVTADGRPAIADPLHATVTLYNGLDDVNPDGSPRDPAVPAVLFYAQIGPVAAVFPFDVSGSKLELDYAQPAADASQGFHLQKVDVTVAAGGKKPFVTTPTTCRKSWLTSMTITNFDGPSITATSVQKCHK